MATHDRAKKFAANPAENYENYFVPAIGAPVAADLIEVAALKSGERVLDVGCGTGVVTRLAAKRTGTKAAGLDMNPAMLGVARAVTPSELLTEWHEASAESMPLPDENFDVVTCQMSLQFVPDKVSAVREMHRVLTPGGRLVLNTPGAMHPFFSIMEGALERHLGGEAAGFLRAVFSLSNPDDVQRLLAEAGFRDVGVETRAVSLQLSEPRNFLWEYVYSTPLVGVVTQFDDDRLSSLEEEIVEKANDRFADWTGEIPQDIVVATGRK